MSGMLRGTMLLLVGMCAAGGYAQTIQLGDARPADNPARRQSVELQTATATVKAGQPDWVEVRFQVHPGMHINSHTPHDELLIPTSFEAGEHDLKVLRVEYPTGVPLRLDVGQGETLSTYQGEFALRLQVTAPKGDSTLDGTLRYQACDSRSCFPPKLLPVRVAVVGR
jgi:hypothetical protein